MISDQSLLLSTIVLNDEINYYYYYSITTVDNSLAGIHDVHHHLIHAYQ